jgi:hypothetical protein
VPQAPVSTRLCPRCGREDDGRSLACALCGELLRRAALTPPTAGEIPLAHPASGSASMPAASEAPPSARDAWLYLGLGLVLAPVFTWTPLLGFMGWFLASLVHEMGHSALAWACGMPSIPVLSPAGHAAAVHGEQMPVLVLALLALAVQQLARLLEGTRRIVAIASFLAVYGLVAFTPLRELLFLLAGHGGELAFATLCLWKALDGGFTDSRAERLAYAVLGWFLLGKNLWLFVGLATSDASRAHYADNGSFGLTNDLMRVAEDVLGWRLESVALLAIPCALAVLPAAFALWRRSRRAR